MRLNSLTNSAGATVVSRFSYGYDLDGQVEIKDTRILSLLSLGRTGGVTTALSYVLSNGEVRLNSLTNSAGTSIVSRFSYGYDLDGLITSLGRDFSGKPSSSWSLQTTWVTRICRCP